MPSPTNLSLPGWSHPDFVDKFPLFLSGASGAPSPVVTFCYVDGDVGKPAGLFTHLLEYRELFGRLEPLQVVYVSTDEGTFARAEHIFRRLCGKLAASARVVADPFLGRLLVLLCYKKGAPQKGQPESCRSRTRAMVCRSVAMEQGLCRSTRAGRTPRAELERHCGDG